MCKKDIGRQGNRKTLLVFLRKSDRQHRAAPLIRIIVRLLQVSKKSLIHFRKSVVSLRGVREHSNPDRQPPPPAGWDNLAEVTSVLRIPNRSFLSLWGDLIRPIG